MNNPDHTKKKIDLMKSILGNPKLARTFRDAMSAPIGSTKREQVKSILSIMKKVGGMNNDGKGGTFDYSTPSPGSVLSNYSTPNYNNLMIFPAAPALKTTSTTPKTGILSNYTLPTMPASINTSLNNGNTSILNNLSTPAQVKTPTFAPSTPVTPTVTPTVSTPTPSTPTSISTKSATEQLQRDLNEKNSGKSGWVPLVVDGIMGPKTQAAQKFTPTVVSSSSNVGTTTQPPVVSEAEKIKSSAKSAVKDSTGAGLFAMDVANEKFGGSLEEYINKLDTKLKTDFNLEPLETELSKLKAQKNNLVPTLTQYIQGKDQYLTFIDKLIARTEGELTKTDMGNPTIANDYNNYLNYLYTLKGRQNQRYGNFLNSAISDYNAEVEKTQSNYDNVYKQYENAITRQGTIAQNEYNTLYTTMADLYTNLEQAPIKALNLETMRLQNLANSLTIAQNAIDQSTNTNVDYWKDITDYTKQITVDNGTTDTTTGSLDMTKIGPDGLISLYAQNAIKGGDQRAMTETIRRALAKTLESSNGDSKKIIEVSKLLEDLKNSGYQESETWANALSNSLSAYTSKSLSSFILPKLNEIKSATKDLVSKSGGFLGFGSSAPGLTNKTKWMEDNSSLGTEFLESLYNTVYNTIGEDTAYNENPSSYLDQLFKGSTDQEKADNLAAIIAVSS